jgi:hypothetical protein
MIDHVDFAVTDLAHSRTSHVNVLDPDRHNIEAVRRLRP